MDKQSFHFTLGPVQGFVAEARRTRDLWVGSYLLSYLAGIGMKALDQKGKIVFPAVYNDPLFKALHDNPKPSKKEDQAARVGSLPNRFKAESDNPEGSAKAVKDAIQGAWKNIAGKAMEKFQKVPGWTPETEDIWNRQVENQWEIAWVIDDRGALFDRPKNHSGDLLEQRKNLRSHYTEEEPGEKCTLCGERQALSKGKEDTRGKVKKWWEDDVEKEFKGFHFLQKGRERLCAICTIKRIFPLIAENAIGWEVLSSYPSTAYLCAVDWIKAALDKATEDGKVKKAIDNFIKMANKADVPHDEQETKTAGISLRLKKHPELKNISNFRGDVFFPDAIKNKSNFPIKDNSRELREKLIKALSDLTKAVGSKPSPFYALLLMDGDNMGKLLSKCQNQKEQERISEALSEFTSHIDAIVEQKHDGKLIYAGGDDVFAMLPLDTALICARDIKDAYIRAFQEKAPEVKGATISAAIVYAHMNSSLRAVIRDAHELLGNVAKEELGRDAFAIRVWKRGGPVLKFAKKWVGKDWINEINRLKEDYSKKGEFASGFFYRLRELIPILNTFPGDKEKIQLLTAEYLKSRQEHGLSDDPEKKREEAEERVKRLLDLSMQNNDICADGPLFIRFLANKEI